jgi:hypothetical protein
MKQSVKFVIIGVAIIVSAWLLADAYTYKYRSEDTITVTGLGETEFSSDLIVWGGSIYAETGNVADGYDRMESYKKQVLDFVTSKGIAAEKVVFNFIVVDKQYATRYSDEGNYMGQYFTGYHLSQEFSIESNDVDTVENISREIS